MWKWFIDLFADFSENVKTFLSESGLKVLLAVLAAAAGIFAVKLILRYIKKRMAAKGQSSVLTSFLVSILRVVLYVIVFLIVITILGIPVTTFLVIASAVSIAVGLAFQSTLANFFSGMSLIAAKPFKIGDYVDIGGVGGTVKSIGIMNTTLITPDNKLTVFPNSRLTENAVTNYSFHKTRRVELQLRAAYGSDIEKIKSIVLETASAHPLVINGKYAEEANAKLLKEKTLTLQEPQEDAKKSPEKKDKKKRFKKKDFVLNLDDNLDLIKADDPRVMLTETGASSLNFILRVWTASENYWTVYYELNERIIETLAENGILIPFNRLDVNLKN